MEDLSHLTVATVRAMISSWIVFLKLCHLVRERIDQVSLAVRRHARAARGHLEELRLADGVRLGFGLPTAFGGAIPRPRLKSVQRQLHAPQVIE